MPLKGAVQLAMDVARGSLKLSELRPNAQKKVQSVLNAYGTEHLKDLATYKPTPQKIGHRATMFRKAMTK